MLLLWLVTLFASVIAPVAYADLGDRVENIATLTQDTSSGTLTFQTNVAAFTIEARSSPSEIDFFRIAPSAPDATPVQLNGSDYSPSGDLLGPFVEIEEAVLFDASASGGAAGKPVKLDTSLPANLVPAETYLSGELIVVRVIDVGHNGYSDQIETVVIQVSTDNGDQITLRLYEDAPDSGHFYAYFQTSAFSTATFDDVITAPQDTVLTATYIDAFDATEISVDTALVDPFGRLFDSFTGELLSGVEITIIDAATGQPAEVMGVDGAGTYPASIRSGEPVTDSAGITYSPGPGVFFYPVLAPGEYRLEVSAPEGYLFPSVRTEEDFEDLLNAPFEIQASGSYNGSFTVTTSGPVKFDVPLDPNGALILRKDASEQTAAIGDFIGYTIELENAGDVPAPFTLQDTLPDALRYVEGSVRLDGEGTSEPDIDQTGRGLRFTGGIILPGDVRRLTYLTSVGPNAEPGEIVNRAVAVNSGGEDLSNVAEAVVTIEEDLLSSTVTIIGRVAEAACSPDEPWARGLEDGTGVAGVRLYMETGRYVVTDENGLYHFEGVEPGTHVVQVDAATLPAGYEPVLCEENTRYAGSAVSKFVDAQGGTLWRANFYLKRTAEADLTETAETPASERPDLTDYNTSWLNQQTDTSPRWVYPETTQTPKGRSVDLGFMHASGSRLHLALNGEEVSGRNFAGREYASSGELALSRWTGVDIQRGENRFEITVSNQEGEVISHHLRTIWFVDEVQNARLVDDQSVAIADGRTRPVIAMRLEDGAGQPVHEGRLVQVSIGEPYRLASVAEQDYERPVASALSASSSVRVGQNGIALVELEPTLQSGRVRVSVPLKDGGEKVIDLWLKPEKRDWVLVGLAEAEGLLSTFEGDGQPSASEAMGDGRVAFFAKGVVRGDWLLTIAVDTAKRRGRADDALFDEIDPDAYYTLYGDRTWQHNNAESRYPVYVKLERQTFQALFGDYETDLTDTQLGRYSRRLSGLKTDYEGERFSVTAFAAETNQRFVKDELAADGTSGPFSLQSAPLVRSSEVITVETRDRFRPDEVLSVQILNRYSDYEIDYTTGELFFRLPVAATDNALNPNVIVVDYETSDEGVRGLTAGGRTAVKLDDQGSEIGLTLIHEEDGSSQGSEGSELISADVTVRVNPQIEVRAELAASTSDAEDGTASGQAWLIEAGKRSENFSLTGYYREETDGFGLGQQPSSTSALRRVGAQLSAELGVREVNGGTDRSVRQVNAQAYREEALSDGSSRDVADVAISENSQTFGASLGLRTVIEEFADAEPSRESVLLTGSLRKTFLEQGLTLSAAHEQPLWGGGGDGDGSTLYPERTILSADKTLGRHATASVRHEITNGGDASGNNTVLGLSWQPRNGTLLSASADSITSEDGRRIGATVGVDQTVNISPAFSVSFGLARRANVDGDDNPDNLTADAALSPLEDGSRSDLTGAEAYTSGYIGAGYRTSSMGVSARYERRDSASGDRQLATVGAVREISKTLSLSGEARYLNERLDTGDDQRELDVRFAAAWRPRGEGMTILNRFDIGHDNRESGNVQSKLVNNFALNTLIGKRTQASFHHGIKYVETEFEGAKANGVTNLLGTEIRYDIAPDVDLGLAASWTSGDASSTSEWAFGPSLGFSPADNVWMSVGWNIEGFEDDDFEAASYSRQGPYIKIRAKFDQTTVQNLAEGLMNFLGTAN